LEHRFDFERNEMATHVGKKGGMCRYAFARRSSLSRTHCSSVPSDPLWATCQIGSSIASLETSGSAPRSSFGAIPYRVPRRRAPSIENGQMTSHRCKRSPVQTASPAFHEGERGGT